MSEVMNGVVGGGVRRSFADVLAEPWSRVVVARWSDPADNGGNTVDIVRETMSYMDQDDPDVVAATAGLAHILDGVGVKELRGQGFVEIRMADVAPGVKGRIGWALVAGDLLVLVVEHSAFEFNVAGEFLDDGRNAYTEVLLRVIRSRRRCKMFFAFDTRMARMAIMFRLLLNAMQQYGWELFFGGQRRDLDDPLMDAVQAGVTEKKTREFHQSTAVGELDDLMAGLYCRAEFGLGLTHRFRRETVTGTHTFERVVDKAVEPNPGAVAVLQVLAPMIAGGDSWEAVGRRAGELGVLARHGVDVANTTGRTLDQLKWPGHAIKSHFSPQKMDLILTGKTVLRWHGKIQGAATYRHHGSATHYTMDQLRAMTPRQRTKAEKGYFTIEVDWGTILAPDSDGVLSPFGVSMKVWQQVAARLAAEATIARSRGAGAHNRDRKPLTGSDDWTIADTRYAILANRTPTYDLHARPEVITAGWKSQPGRTLAVWRAEDEHAAAANALIEIVSRLGDHDISLTRTPPAQTETRVERLTRQAGQWSTQAEQVARELDAIPTLARALTAKGLVDQATETYEAAPGLRAQIADLRARAACALTRADTPEPDTTQTHEINVATLTGVAAGLLAYPVLAPPQLGDACVEIFTHTTAEVINKGLSVRITRRVQFRLPDRSPATHDITYLVPNRKRGTKGIDSSVFEHVARLWFTAPTPITFADIATQTGYSPAEVRRKIMVWLGGGHGLPRNMARTVRVPAKSMRSALVDCPIIEVRHALWAALMPDEASIADYLTSAYRTHIAATYLSPTAVWCASWAADTHIFRRRLIDLCMNQPDIKAGVRFDAAARHLGIAETDINDFSRPYLVDALRNQAPPYPPTVTRLTPFNRANGDLDVDLKRVIPVRCPHRGCEGKKRGRNRGWCTIVLRVPELAQWALLCPDCRRVPDLAKPDLRFPAAYLTEWQGPRGFKTGNGGTRKLNGTTQPAPENT